MPCLTAMVYLEAIWNRYHLQETLDGYFILLSFASCFVRYAANDSI